jgi:glycosyltransferase involved in cell wall biosynthesis
VADAQGAAEPIKVLRVIARLNVGGPALHVAYLTAGLADRGYETTLVAGTLAYGEESMASVSEARGVRIETLPALHREIGPLRDARAILRLARLIREQRPAILHTHTAKAGAVGRIAALLAGGARPPIVVHTFHGHVLRGYFNPVTTFGFRTLERWLARITTALIAVSPEVRDDLVKLHVAPASKFAIVRLGIELDERTDVDSGARAETRRQLGIGEDAFIVGWVGRMTAVKRTDDVIRALRGLVERGVDAYLCLVGDGPDRDHLERYAHELGVVKRCLFVGYQDDVARFYSAIDALVLPSVNEGTPVSVMEALAAQRPVVATRVGGTPDVIRDGVDGYLVEVGDANALSERLAGLANDPERRARMGAKGREQVLGR